MATYLPYSDVVAAYGYRQPRPARQRSNVVLLAFAYVFMGGALGTVAGASLAMATIHTTLPTLAFQVDPAVQASSTVDNAVAPPSQTSALRSHTSGLHSSIAKPSPLKFKSAGIQVADHHYAQPRYAQPLYAQPSSAQTLFAQPSNAQPKQIAVTTDSPKIATPSHDSAATPSIPVAVETQPKSYTFFSEGDTAVADFDASVGRIETYDGRKFVIDASAAASAAETFQDSGTSIHYRCDQSGNCTLMRGGLVLQNARLM
jgi:hypothetical protein